MSRQNIDLTQPLSDDEREYLEARNMQRELDENAMNLMGGGTDKTEAETAPSFGQSAEGFNVESDQTGITPALSPSTDTPEFQPPFGQV